MKLPLLAALVLSLCLPAQSRPDQPAKLSPEEEQQLARDKIIVTPRTWKQIFSPYIFSREPVFITTDSVLNAWHVLFEESFAALEDRASLRSRPALEAALAEMKENPAEVPEALREQALRRAQIVLGTAARLTGSTWSGGAEVDAMIAEQVRLVEAAKAVTLPSWLPAGYGVAGIDYRVFKPTGFYTRSPRFERYFRTLRWLQTVPFRARVDEEMAAMSLIAKAVWEEGSLPALAELYQSLGGKAADADVLTLKELSTSHPMKEIETWQNQHEGETARVVVHSAIAFSDAKLFLKTIGSERPFPDSLEVAAWLGSTLAEELLRQSAGDQVMAAISRYPRAASDNATVYDSYLDCAAILLTPAEPDAPAFMNSLPWRRKSLHTALSGWAQLRHTWALQAKEDAMWLSGILPFPGFVEPNPAFYLALSELILRCIVEFDKLGALEFSTAALPADAAALIPRIEAEGASWHKRMEPFIKKFLAGGELSEQEQSSYEEAKRIPAELCEALTPLVRILDGVSTVYPGPKITGLDDVERLLASLREIAAGRRLDDLLKQEREYGDPTLRERWLELVSVCQRLESRAHRQLRGLEPTETEARFITAYGSIIGGIMFYEGNSYHSPRDDAPRVATVFNQPGGKCLLAGTGRPREIRVLYPWKGKEVNCRGAILTFHEMKSEQRLTDAEWRQRLDSESPPPVPEWLRPLLAPDAAAQKP
jgi:hypothetical protein